ncbi:MAG: DUF4350 domain-containing protein [Candidatus Bathyarchaeota archaeon]
MNKAQLSVLLGAVGAFTLLIGVTVAYPSLDDLWLENPFWNGLSEFYAEVKPLRMGGLSGLQGIISPGNTTLFIIGPSTAFSGEEVTWIRNYLHRGGTLVLADDFGTGNQLLDGLEVEARFSGGLLKDPLFRDKSALLPITLHTMYDGVDNVVFNYATVLTDVNGAEVKAWSSPFSVLEAVGELQPDMGSWPLVAELSLRTGKLVLVSDSSSFINGMIRRGDNRQLLWAILKGEAVIDEAHSMPSRLTVIKSGLTKAYTVLRSLELRYGFALFIVAGVMAVRFDDGGEPVDEVDAVMAAHPEYDRGLVERLYLERRARGE